MKMFEFIPYMLELDPEAEVKLIEDLEPGETDYQRQYKLFLLSC